MPLANATTKIIASGAWVQVRVKEKKTDPFKVIGLATDASYTEDFGLQEGKCLNHLGPISIDSTDYRCSIQIGTFVPEVAGADGKYADGGDTTLNDLLPTRSSIQTNGKGKVFEVLDFYNTATQEVLNEFAYAIIESDGARIGPNQYVTNNVSLRAIERTI